MLGCVVGGNIHWIGSGATRGDPLSYIWISRNELQRGGRPYTFYLLPQRGGGEGGRLVATPLLLFYVTFVQFYFHLFYCTNVGHNSSYNLIRLSTSRGSFISPITMGQIPNLNGVKVRLRGLLSFPFKRTNGPFTIIHNDFLPTTLLGGVYHFKVFLGPRGPLYPSGLFKPFHGGGFLRFTLFGKLRVLMGRNTSTMFLHLTFVIIVVIIVIAIFILVLIFILVFVFILIVLVIVIVIIVLKVFTFVVRYLGPTYTFGSFFVVGSTHIRGFIRIRVTRNNFGGLYLQLGHFCGNGRVFFGLK